MNDDENKGMSIGGVHFPNKEEDKPRNVTPSMLKSQIRSLKRELAKGHRLLNLRNEVGYLSKQLQDLNDFLAGKIDRYSRYDYMPEKDPK